MVSWIACFAILLMALVPAISHAVRPDAPTGWAEICSVTGAKLVPLDDTATSEPGSGEPQVQALEHCPYCSLHSSALGMPPTPPAGLALMTLAFEHPELFWLAPRTLFAWASAQPRAPPLNT
jgi:Protein of unknown function (DUF2946)